MKQYIDARPLLEWLDTIEKKAQPVALGKAYLEAFRNKILEQPVEENLVPMTISPVCFGCDGRDAEGNRTEKCVYPGGIFKCMAQAQKMLEILEAYHAGELMKREVENV